LPPALRSLAPRAAAPPRRSSDRAARRVPPDSALALAPRVAIQIRGGAVVEDAAVRRPCPALVEEGAWHALRTRVPARRQVPVQRDRKSTRLNSSHGKISYAVSWL